MLSVELRKSKAPARMQRRKEIEEGHVPDKLIVPAGFTTHPTGGLDVGYLISYRVFSCEIKNPREPAFADPRGCGVTAVQLF
jgi:hypothetical protein